LRVFDEKVCSVATFCVAWANSVRLSKQAVPVADPAKPLNNSAKNLEEATPIGVVEENLCPCIPAV
jgi:hypothetical protein